MARTLPALRFSTALYRFRESLLFLPLLVVVLGAVLADPDDLARLRAVFDDADPAEHDLE